ARPACAPCKPARASPGLPRDANARARCVPRPIASRTRAQRSCESRARPEATRRAPSVTLPERPRAARALAPPAAPSSKLRVIIVLPPLPPASWHVDRALEPVCALPLRPPRPSALERVTASHLPLIARLEIGAGQRAQVAVHGHGCLRL